MKNRTEKKRLSQYWKKLPPFFQGRMLRNLGGGSALLLLSVLMENGLGDFGHGFFALGLICAVYCIGSAGITFYRAYKGEYLHFGGTCVKTETVQATNRILLIRRKASVQKVTLRREDGSTVDLECPGERLFLEGEYYDCYFSRETEHDPSVYLGYTHTAVS